MMIRTIGVVGTLLMAMGLTACASIPVEGTGADLGAHPSVIVSQAPLGANAATTGASAPVDAQFIDQMIAYHQNAIELANVALGRARQPDLRTRAATIIETRRTQINRMRAWRAAWYPNLEPTNSLEQTMDPVRISSDTETSFDQRFLAALIPLDEQAVQLARDADGNVEHEELQTLIKQIIIIEGDNVAEMKRWQQEWQ